MHSLDSLSQLLFLPEFQPEKFKFLIFQKHIKLDVKNRTDATVALLFVGVPFDFTGP